MNTYFNPLVETGETIDIGLTDNVKAVISNADQYARKNEVNIFWNTTAFMANTSVNSDLTVTGNIINANLNNKISKIHNSCLAIYNGYSKFFKLGTLNMPNGGHHAVINFNACYGYGVAHGLNSPSYSIQNYQMTAHIYSSTLTTSRSVFNGTLGFNDPRHLNPDYSIYYNGFVVVTSPLITPLGMYLAPVPTNPTNQVDVWVRSYPWHGQPLIQVVQSEGTFTRAPAIENDFIPYDGWIALDMYSNTLTQIYRNPENPNW